MERSEGTQPTTAKEAREFSAKALEEARKMKPEVERLTRSVQFLIDRLTFLTIVNQK